MNYWSLRKDLARDLNRCVKLGLPVWVKDHIEERAAYAAHWWGISRDRDQPADFRRDSYTKAVRVQCGLLDLLGAYWISVKPPAAHVDIRVTRHGNGGQHTEQRL